ncbi:hypothetical protein [Geomonas agri]|uniref:hypothetical protein n=1 Tax=Geomonas agri TaxID=2873702 RepID=UPI001CD3E221|nr:hypothetical protein [Geomonas agri]
MTKPLVDLVDLVSQWVPGVSAREARGAVTRGPWPATVDEAGGLPLPTSPLQGEE